MNSYCGKTIEKKIEIIILTVLWFYLNHRLEFKLKNKEDFEKFKFILFIDLCYCLSCKIIKNVLYMYI
jgi:hypothetical protein